MSGFTIAFICGASLPGPCGCYHCRMGNMSVSSGFLVLPTDTPADLLPLLTSQPLSMAASWEEVEEAVLEPEGHRCHHGLQVVLGWASEGGKEQVLVRSICYQAALRIRSANSLPPALVPQPWQSAWPDQTPICSRGPLRSSEGSMETRRPGCPCPPCHQAPGTLAESLSLPEMSYFV